MSDFVHGDQADVHHGPPVHEKVHEKDLEHGLASNISPSFHDVDDSSSISIRAHKLQEGNGFLRSLRNGENWLDRKMGIETQGVDRIPDNERKPPSLINIFFMWWSMTCHVGTIPIGILGPEFGLSLNQSVAAIVVGTALGALCPAYCGTLGPKLGLRAIATSRYSFGFYGAKLCSVLNIVIGGGFAVVNYVVVGQILAAVSDYSMTLIVGCVIIGIISYALSVFGFAFIHTFEKYSWIASFIICLVLLGQTGGKVDASIPGEDSGLGLAGSFLSILAICFSSSSGWCSMASDYYVNYPENTKSWKIFTLTFFGVCIPTTFTTVIGALLGNIAISNPDTYPVLSGAYHDHGLGGLLREALHPIGFSKFCLVLLTFSVLGNNIAINYSSGLSLQLLGHYFHAVPRFIWSFLNGLVITVLAIAGREHLSLIVSNFVSLLGYWTISFTFILLIEDKIFRRHGGYNLAAWDNPKLLPWGLAAVMSLLAGYLAGGVPGMQQTWYTGPIAAKIGDFGGDVGIYLSGAITLVTYPPLRYLEKKKTGL